MKPLSAVFIKYWRLNILQIKNSSSMSYLGAFIAFSFLFSMTQLNLHTGANNHPLKELSTEDNMSAYYIWFFRNFIFLFLTLQYCAFIEADMTQGSMFHRYSLGLSSNQQCGLIVSYLLFFTILYHVIGCFFVTVKFMGGGAVGPFYYIQQFGILRLCNECIRMLLLGILTSNIYLYIRKSALTFLFLFLLWVAETIFILFDEYYYAWGYYKYLPLHNILSYDFLTTSVSMVTLMIMIYASILAWFFYKSIQKTKESIILNHFT